MAQATTKSQKNRKLFERRHMKTERSFFWIWTDWLEDKAPFHPDTPAWGQLQSLEISSLSSSIHNNPSLSCVRSTRNPKHQQQWYTGGSFTAGVEKVSWKHKICLCKFKSTNWPRTFTHIYKDTALVLHWSVTPPTLGEVHATFVIPLSQKWDPNVIKLPTFSGFMKI